MLISIELIEKILLLKEGALRWIDIRLENQTDNFMTQQNS